MTTRTACALMTTLFLAGAPQDPSQPTATETFILEAGDHDLIKVIAASAHFLGRNYLLSPTELGNSQKVTLQKKLELDAAGCEAIVSQLAYAQNLVATPLDHKRGLWEFINVNGARRTDAMRGLVLTPDEVRRKRDVRIYVTTYASLQHARASVASQTLRPFFAGAGGGGTLSIGTGGTEQTILLQGLAEQVAQALDVIAQVDQPQATGPVEDARFAALEARVKALEDAAKR